MKPCEFWVPEDYVYLYASDCLMAHPEQAAALVRDDGDYLKLKEQADKLAEALASISSPDFGTEIWMTDEEMLEATQEILDRHKYKAKKALAKYRKEEK